VGPGGNGDGVWSFAVPPQTGQGGKDFRFTLTAYDHTGRDRTSSQQAVQIIASDVETARNGLPDWWLMQHFGNLNQTRTGDPDNDRVINILEYLFGTDPNNSDDSLLQGYWRFNGANGNDSSVWERDATVHGGTFVDNGVMGGKFLRLAETGDRLDVGFAPVFKAAPLTLMAYFRPDALPASEAVLWDNLTDTAGMRIAITSEGHIRVTTLGPEGKWTDDTDDLLQSGERYHLALTADSDSLTLYINANPVIEATITGFWAEPTVFTPTTMGNLATPTADFQFTGDLDEVMVWGRVLSQRELAIAAGIFLDHPGGFEAWRTGHREGEYTTDDHTNFVWNASTKTLAVSLPNRARQADQPYAYQFTDRQSQSFHFSFETTVTTPGFEAPLRFGLKQDPAANWGSDQGLSCTFAFRSSGFRLELFVRDGSNNTRTHEWTTGFRLDEPPRWVRGTYLYDHVTEVLAFTLHDADTGELLAEHTFTGVKPFAANMDRFVVSARGDAFAQSGHADTVTGLIRDVSVTPVAFGPLLPGGTTENGVPLSWLREYGLPEDGSSDHIHLNGSPFSVWQHWRAGTHPHDPDDDLRMTDGPAPSPSGVTVRWRSVPTRTYRIERSSNLLATPPFTTIATGIQGIDGISEFLDETGIEGATIFYRIVVE